MENFRRNVIQALKSEKKRLEESRLAAEIAYEQKLVEKNKKIASLEEELDQVELCFKNQFEECEKLKERIKAYANLIAQCDANFKSMPQGQDEEVQTELSELPTLAATNEMLETLQNKCNSLILSNQRLQSELDEARNSAQENCVPPIRGVVAVDVATQTQMVGKGEPSKDELIEQLNKKCDALLFKNRRLQSNLDESLNSSKMSLAIGGVDTVELTPQKQMNDKLSSIHVEVQTELSELSTLEGSNEILEGNQNKCNSLILSKMSQVNRSVEIRGVHAMESTPHKQMKANKNSFTMKAQKRKDELIEQLNKKCDALLFKNRRLQSDLNESLNSSQLSLQHDELKPRKQMAGDGNLIIKLLTPSKLNSIHVEVMSPFS